jgi:ABC-type multidrug transport system fused ATPase/permease subunit
MKLFTEIWRLLDRRDRLWLLLSPLLAILIGLSALVGIAAVIPFFAVLGDPATIHRSALLARAYATLGFASDRAFLVALGIAFVALLLVSNAASLLGFLAIRRYSDRVGERFHAALLAEYLHRDLLFHARSHGAQLINNIVYEAERVASGVVHGALTVMSNAVTGLLIVAAVIALNPRMAAAAIVGLGGSYGLAYLLVRRRVVASGAVLTHQAEARIRIVTESLGGIRDILLSGGQAGVLRRFAVTCAAISRATSSALTVAQAPRHVIECVTGAGLVAMALVLTAHEGGTAAWLAPVTFLGLAAYRLLPALQQVFAASVRIRTDRAAFDRIRRDLALGTERLRSAQATPARGVFQGAPRSELRLSAVTFGYVSDGPRAVRDVSLSIKAGTMVGLVGANGSGKTTLADLALGLLVPDAGTIEIDGIRLDDGTRAAWRAATAYVPQTIFLSDTTIAENIANSDEPKEIDWVRLRTAGAMARLDAFVGSLADGYRTPIGERGVRLSGGQRQRIGIARALYRDASMLVLDEATSALDGLSEHEVLDALEALRHKATVLLIAHRLDSLARCDLIIELENGTIVNHGRFEELLARSQRLRRIADLNGPLRRRS